MNSKRNLLDDDDLFEEVRAPVLPSKPSKQKEERVVGKKKLQVLMGRHGAPPGWRGNVVSKHCEDGSKNHVYTLSGAIECIETACRCVRCMQEEYECVAGPVWSDSASFPVEELERRGYVGLYDPQEKEQQELLCSICEEPIRSNGRISVDLKDNEEVVHLGCLSEEAKAQLVKLGYRRPYFIRDKEEQGVPPEPEGDGEGECGK